MKIVPSIPHKDAREKVLAAALGRVRGQGRIRRWLS